MRVVTWNVNSIRLRLPHLQDIVERIDPDVLCLQETKVSDDLFPREAITRLGFEHIAVAGMKAYNGVAIASRLPLGDVRRPQWCGRDDCRHLAVTVAGIDLHCLYVPAGGDIPDPDANPKFAHKLAFLDEVAAWFGNGGDANRPVMMVGDFNIAPLPTDVWSHKQLLGVVSHTPVEVERLEKLRLSLDWVDAVRHFIPPDERLFTWWSYRASDWTKGNRGRRLDHIWVTPVLAPGLVRAHVLAEARGWPSPSDHVPVMVEVAADAESVPSSR